MKNLFTISLCITLGIVACKKAPSLKNPADSELEKTSQDSSVVTNVYMFNDENTALCGNYTITGTVTEAQLDPGQKIGVCPTTNTVGDQIFIIAKTCEPKVDPGLTTQWTVYEGGSAKDGTLQTYTAETAKSECDIYE